MMINEIRKLLKYINYLRYSFTNKISISRGGNNKLITNYSMMKNCRIKIIGKNNLIEFKENCHFSGLSILMIGNNNIIQIGRNTIINASRLQPTIINAIHGRRIILGDNCLLSNNIEIHSSDYHKILDYNKRLSNPPKDIVIGNHVWIGLRTVILKGTVIPNNVVIGANSLLNSELEGENCIIAGNPSRIVKRNISWDY